MRRIRTIRGVAISLVSLAAFTGCNQDEHSHAEMPRRVSQSLEASTDCAPEVNIDRSLAVTELAAMAPFSMREMLETLVSQGPEPTQDPVAMFAEMSASLGGCAEGENTKPMGEFQMKCLNGTLGRPGTPEDVDPFGEQDPANGYFPVGVFNRFDLAPESGETCGEYRIVFARHSGLQNGFVTGQRRLIIFEAVLPNPQPEAGLEGCRPVAEFWAGLSEVEDVAQRGAAIHDFYMNGLPGFGPVVHINNYGLSGLRGSGQIRSNSFLNHQWSQNEFRTDNCEGTCPLTLALATAKDVPAPEVLGRLTPEGERHPLADAFREEVLLPAALDASHPLHSDNANTIRFSYDDKFNAFGSDAATRGGTLDSTTVVAGSTGLTDWLQQEMDAAAVADVTLNATQIIKRVQTQTCGGCHSDSSTDDLGDGVTQPSSFDFTHVNERVEEGPDGPRRVMSSGLKNDFLPFRKGVLEAFLAPASCDGSLGGFEVLSDWSVESGFASLNSDATEGQSSLGVSHTGGYVRVSSALVSAGELFGESPQGVSLDVRVPAQQPNPWYVGDLRVEISCPQIHIHGAYVGNTGLTSLPREQFSTVQLGFPSWVRSAIAQSPDTECRWHIGLSVNQGAGDYLLDNLSVQ